MLTFLTYGHMVYSAYAKLYIIFNYVISIHTNTVYFLLIQYHIRYIHHLLYKGGLNTHMYNIQCCKVFGRDFKYIILLLNNFFDSLDFKFVPICNPIDKLNDRSYLFIFNLTDNENNSDIILCSPET